MTMITRDPWADAHQVVTRAVLEPGLVALRRRLWLRRAVWLILGAALAGAIALVPIGVDPGSDRWLPRLGNQPVGWSLVGAGVVLLIIGSIRTAGSSQPFVEPLAYLPRDERAWLRAQIAEGRVVADERRVVVSDAARRMVVEGRSVPTYLGLAFFYVGTTVALPSPAFLVTFSALTLWAVVSIVRGIVWSRRAHRWLARNA